MGRIENKYIILQCTNGATTKIGFLPYRDVAKMPSSKHSSYIVRTSLVNSP